MKVTERDWFKKEYSLYENLNTISSIALKDLNFIKQTNGNTPIILTAKERKERTKRIDQARDIFKLLEKHFYYQEGFGNE